MSTDQKSVYELNLHEETTIRTGKKVMRVPGGWIYTTIHSLDEGMIGFFFPILKKIFCSTFLGTYREILLFSDKLLKKYFTILSSNE